MIVILRNDDLIGPAAVLRLKPLKDITVDDVKDDVVMSCADIERVIVVRMDECYVSVIYDERDRSPVLYGRQGELLHMLITLGQGACTGMGFSREYPCSCQGWAREAADKLTKHHLQCPFYDESEVIEGT